MLPALHFLTDKLLGLLFPDRCASCGQVGSLFCEACRAQLRPYPAGSPAATGTHDLAALLDAASVAFVFEGPLRAAVHCFKYKRVRRMAGPLGDLLAAHLQTHPLPADALIPVPLHRNRQRERGFNQSEVLAQRLAPTSGLPLLTNGLIRCRDTQRQARLDLHGRQENLRDAFVWQGSVPPPERILLLDDVLTTGATISACTRALRAAGAREVRVLALARSRPDA